MEAFGRKMFEIVVGMVKNIQKLVEILLLVCIRKKSPVYV